MLQVQKLSETAVVPTRGTTESAGLDLYAAHATSVPAHGKALVKTDLAVAIPFGHYGRIAPRSSLAWKHHIDVGAGVIDSDYRGNVGVVLFNHSDVDVDINLHDRVAQLIIEKVAMLEVTEVKDLQETQRGDGGFGSTGK